MLKTKKLDWINADCFPIQTIIHYIAQYSLILLYPWTVKYYTDTPQTIYNAKYIRVNKNKILKSVWKLCFDIFHYNC